MTDREFEEKTLNTEDNEENKPVEVYSETAETEVPDLDDEQIRAAALAYAKYLREKGLKPGEATFVEPEDLGVDLEEKKAVETEEENPEEAEEPKTGEEEPEAEEQKPEDEAEEKKEEEEKPETAAEEEKPEPEKKLSKKQKKKQKEKAKKHRDYKKQFMKKTGRNPLASVTDIHDKAQDRVDQALVTAGKDMVIGAHRMAAAYTNSRRVIGLTLLLIGIVAAAMLILFDRLTVYEYAYNGKVLGYVHEQEEVTDVLGIAGKKLSSGRENGVNVEFAANQNVTFNLVESRGKSTDDADTVVNKLIYMTDIETEAYAVYDGDRVVAIVKDQEAAENLLAQTMGQLSVPDRGMVLVSAEFTNNLNSKPINVLLGSVQSNAVAQKQMVEGGKMETFHIVEEGETTESLAAEFGVDTLSIYDEENNEVVEEIEQGDKVCVRSTVDPVSVKMVESGRVKEIIEYETIKKESDEYYKGDTYLEQDGVNGVQIFEGTITKVGGVETKRKESKPPEVLTEKKDKIIIVGTAERPKTAATGTFIKPLEYFTMTSGFGPRWGRHHNGVDLAVHSGTPFVASDGGKVVRAGWYGGYGMCIDIDHGNGNLTRYGHCSRIYVSVGDLVYQGQTIGCVGNTGWSTGPHLHFEVYIEGVRSDPEVYVDFF